jgi:hypothetical protein
MATRKDLLGCRFYNFSETKDFYSDYLEYSDNPFDGCHTPNTGGQYGYFVRNEYFQSEIFLELFEASNGNK